MHRVSATTRQTASGPVRDKMAIPAVNRVREYLKHVGWRRTIICGVYVGLNQFVRVSVFEVMILKRESINRDLLVRDELECRFLREYEMLRCAAQSGDRCYAILDGGRLANIGFFSNRPTPLLGDLEINFDSKYWYMSGALTLPEYRGRRRDGCPNSFRNMACK